jgi:hypothetical protein
MKENKEESIDIVEFSLSQQISNAEFWLENIDQNYHPSGFFGEESKSIVYSKEIVNTTKFFPILLKEWFFVLKKDGYLIIDYVPNKIIDYKGMEQVLWWLLGQRYDLIYHGKIHSSLEKMKVIEMLTDIPKIGGQKYYRVICQKIETTKIHDDSINRWTFGIVSNGMRQDWVDLCIQSIRNQKIPEYEIIICGKYHGKDGDLKYIHFERGDDRGWITKKKNLINSLAKYQNICLMHDRYKLSDDWFEKTKEYGNSFEFLSNPQYFNDIRAGDWISLGRRKFAAHKIRLIDYRDWDKYIIISGGLFISKKNILKKVPLNESLYWNEGEDVQLSHDMIDSGYIPRINSAKVDALSFRFGRLPFRPFEKYIYWPDMPVRRCLTILAYVLNLIPGMHKLIFNLSKKTGIYKIFYKL